MGNTYEVRRARTIIAFYQRKFLRLALCHAPYMESG